MPSYEEHVRRQIENATAHQQVCPVTDDINIACTLEKVSGGYKVKRERGKGYFSKKPQSKAKAVAQLRVIEMNKHRKG